MPWEIREENGQYCVYKKDGELKKCYRSKARATAYLKALYANVPDAKGSEEIVFEQVNGTVHFDLVAQAEGDLLVFKNAVLARAETNRNRDEIDADGIRDLAATIAGRPIDFEHDPRINVGFYTSGRATQDNALSVDGAIWADRYPKVAEDVKNGSLLQSIEATAQSAMCSLCGGVFASKDDYCDHLKGRRGSDVVRKLKDLKAKGGGVTYKPAGTNTAFSNEIFMVASHQEDATVKSQAESKEGRDNMDEKEKVEKERLEGAGDAVEKDKEQEEARKKAEAEKKDQGVKAFEETIASLNKALEDKKAELEAVATELKAAKELASTLEAKLKNQILASAFGDEELKELELKVGSWSLEQVEVLASVPKSSGQKGKGPVGLEVTGKSSGKEPLTITLKGAK